VQIKVTIFGTPIELCQFNGIIHILYLRLVSSGHKEANLLIKAYLRERLDQSDGGKRKICEQGIQFHHEDIHYIGGLGASQNNI